MGKETGMTVACGGSEFLDEKTELERGYLLVFKYSEYDAHDILRTLPPPIVPRQNTSCCLYPVSTKLLG